VTIKAKNVVKVGTNPANSEKKANKAEKKDLLRFVASCDGLAGCVGSGKF
jgi:hypothetical protein